MTSRRDLAFIAATSFTAGVLAYATVDRIAFMTGHRFRDARYAGRTA
jgi:hypothetical protein